VTNEHKKVYIVNKIALNLNKYALLITTKEKLIKTFLTINEIIINSYKISNNNNFKAKQYNLWYRRFAYLRVIKLRKLYKIITLQKLILIVESVENSYKICALIKLCNKRNHYVSKRKVLILTLVFIDICDSLSLLRLKYEYFLKIVDNYSRKT